MGKTSKKSKKHHRKRSSSGSSDSSEAEERRSSHKVHEEKNPRKREASDEGKLRGSKWDSPEEDSSSHRRHRERNPETYREDQRRGQREAQEGHSKEEQRDFRDDRRRRDDRRGREDEQDRGRRQWDDRRRNEQEDRQQDREGNRRRGHHRSRSPNRRFPRRGEDDRKYEWGKREDKPFDQDKPPVEKEKPNFGLSGKLTEDTNKVNGVVIKYAEPPEARKPKRRWRLYPFKGEQALATMYIHRQSCYLIGRDHKVCDLRVDHPSCSKQHAALQYRLVPFEREDGSVGKRVRLYLIDLESSNGTYVNNNRIEARKYTELLEKDVIKFGFSSREYVLLHENSHEETLDDDVNLEQEEAAEVKTEPAD